MKALNVVLEADLRAISAESRKKLPEVKDAAEYAILKVMFTSSKSNNTHEASLCYCVLERLVKLVFLYFQLRSLSDPESIAQSEDLLNVFIASCEAKQPKLSALGLSSLQKLMAHDAIDPEILPRILGILVEVQHTF